VICHGKHRHVVIVPVGSGLPSLADDKVSSVAERDGVAIVGGREVDIAAGLVVLVVVLATSKAVGIELEVEGIGSSNWLSSWGGEGADCGGEREDNGGESDHFGKL
jgi:hypothetical protein